MKKTLKVNLYKSGGENDILTRLIANYNEGKVQISPRDLEGYLITRNAIYPTLHNFSLIKGDSPNEYHISEDGGKTFTMSLEWCENYILEPAKETEEFLPNNINA